MRAGVQARSTKSKARLDRFEQLRNQRFKEQEEILELTPVSTRLGKQTIEWKGISYQYENSDPLFRISPTIFFVMTGLELLEKTAAGKARF